MSGTPLEAADQVFQNSLPRGSTFGDIEADVPIRLFRSEQEAGQRSQDSLIGELIFESPRLLGGLARDIGMSCDTCHIRGGSNPAFFIPGGSTTRGTFNRAPALFHPASQTHAVKAITIPSLVGISAHVRFGHDGRSPSLQSFALDVITDEFAGPRPSPQILDRLIAYLEDLEISPHQRLAADMTLKTPTADEQRGEALFQRAFGAYSSGCATCHDPARNFSDRKLHTIGTGSELLRTPSLLTREQGQPYFHDGSAATLADAVAKKSETFGLDLDAAEQNALIAYISALESANENQQPATAALALDEIDRAKRGLEFAVKSGDAELIAIAADGFARKLQNLTNRFDERIEQAEQDRIRTTALSSIADAAIATFQLRSHAEANAIDPIMDIFKTLVRRLEAMREPVLNAEPYSLFDRQRLRDYRAKIDTALNH